MQMVQSNQQLQCELSLKDQAPLFIASEELKVESCLGQGGPKKICKTPFSL